jgi:hypothetical protein
MPIEGPIRRTREGGIEWEPIKILLEGDRGLSHVISGEKPNASHMCARIKLHTYDRQKSVLSLTVLLKCIIEFNHLLHSGVRQEGL